MYQHKSGYAPGEAFAIHARRRFRLLPPKFPNPNQPNPDHSLWIVYYHPAEANDRLPSNMIPLDQRSHNLLQTRLYLQTQGQIVEKQFMLHDRANWPQITFPRNPSRQSGLPAGATRPTQTKA